MSVFLIDQTILPQITQNTYLPYNRKQTKGPFSEQNSHADNQLANPGIQIY